MKITKTTLLFIATLFFLALPMMFTSGNAQAYVYNYDGAVHNAAGGWTMPADNGTCIGADANTPVDGNAQNLGKQGLMQNCGSVQPAWVAADFTTQAACTGAGYAWTGSCSKSGHYHYAAECTADGGVWTPDADGVGSCENMWYSDTSAAYEAGTADHECLYCHDGGHGYNMGGYLKSGHKNMSRAADGLPWAGSIANGSTVYSGINWDNPGTTANGTPYWATLDDGTPLFWIYDGWIGTTPRTVTPGSSYSCGRCHTTGWTADATMQTTKEPVATFGPSIYQDVNLAAADDSGTMQPFSSWDHFGVLCSRCHNAVDGGHANSGPSADDMDTSLPAGGPSQVAKCLNCHRQVNSLNLPDNEHAPYPGEDLWISAGHGSPSLESHATGYLNSPHARFSGKFSELEDSTKYDSHFVTKDGTCAGCHNVHDSLTDTDAGAQPFFNECGISCHNPASTYDTPRIGFHDNVLAAGTMPSTVSTAGACSDLTKTTETDCDNAGADWFAAGTAGSNFDACVTCHMPNGLHLFRISVDANYTTYPGANQLIPTVPNPQDNNFPEAFVDAGLVCLQCHGAKTCSKSTYTNQTDCESNGGTWKNAAGTDEFSKAAVASGVSGDYHTEPTVFYATGTDGTAMCLKCHADKSTFVNTGHYNMLRKVNPGTELYGPNGVQYSETAVGPNGEQVLASGVGFNWQNGTYNDGTTTVQMDYVFNGWLGFLNPPYSTNPLVVDSNGLAEGSMPYTTSCAMCHTTGYSSNPADETASRHPLVDYPSFPTATGGTGSWDESGVRCIRCHGANTEATTHTASAPSGVEVTALCSECHQGSHHDTGFLNSPHARFTDTTDLGAASSYANLANPANYNSHFATYYGGCTACHNVHQSLVITGAKPFYNECGINCHTQTPNTDPYAKPLQEINHPNGPGTPLYGVTADDAQDACIVCHMATKSSRAGIHYFQINADDPDYVTPAVGGGSNDSYVSISDACGQCHFAANVATSGAPEMTAAELVPYAQAMHGGSVDTQKLFIWTNDGSEDFKVNFQVTGSACPEGGCTYSWDFGDSSSAGSGPTPSHTYADGTSENVILTITYPDHTTFDNTQTVTPTAVHKLPTCAIATDPAAVTTGNVGDMISFTDASQAGDPADTPNLGVIVNWGDGTAFTSGNAGDLFTHTYMVNGDYRVVETVKDSLGFNCENDIPVTINKPNVAVTTTGLTLNALYSGTWGTPETISYYVKGLNAFGQMVTKASGTLAPGTQTTVDLGPTTYDVYLYYPTGHSCTPSTNPTHVDLSSGAATVLIYGCN